MVVAIPNLPEKPALKSVNQDDWFLTTEELHRALLSDNNQNFDIRVVNLLQTLFAGDVRAGNIDLDEFRNIWDYIDQWKEVFEKVKRDRKISLLNFKQVLSELDFSLPLLNRKPRTSVICDFSFTPELCENIFRRFNHSTSGELSFDEFIHSIITLQACYEKKTSK